MGLIRQKDPAQQLREPLRIPPLCKLDDWQARQAVMLTLQLSAQAPKPTNDIELAYASGLAALARSELESAVAQFTTVVEQDALWAYSSAKLLVLVLYRALGDASTLTDLTDACMATAPFDKFAARAVANCTLTIYKHVGDETGIKFDSMLLYPAIASQLANAGPQLQLATAGQRVIHNRLADRAASLVAALDLVVATRWQPQFQDKHTLNAMAGRRDLLNELAFTACSDYLFLGESDAALEIISRVNFVGDVYLKAKALADKGLTDAALVAYDDASKDGKKQGKMYQYSARYDKAKVLVEIGDLTRARKELARLYADEPSYTDKDGLLDAVKPRGRPTSRAAIPEDVRHAVWRRDEGRCVQCGSQERLEFDHIIPVSRGGANTERNLQLLCERCNREKSARI